MRRFRPLVGEFCGRPPEFSIILTAKERESSMRRQRGFPLIELMIAIAIVAILAGIALPSYNNYITRGKIQEGTSALLATRIKMEQFFQDNRAYPATCVTAPTVPNATQVQVPALKYFGISCP